MRVLACFGPISRFWIWIIIFISPPFGRPKKNKLDSESSLSSWWWGWQQIRVASHFWQILATLSGCLSDFRLWTLYEQVRLIFCQLLPAQRKLGNHGIHNRTASEYSTPPPLSVAPIVLVFFFQLLWDPPPSFLARACQSFLSYGLGERHFSGCLLGCFFLKAINTICFFCSFFQMIHNSPNKDQRGGGNSCFKDVPLCPEQWCGIEIVSFQR